jgi:hypothetical protein
MYLNYLFYLKKQEIQLKMKLIVKFFNFHSRIFQNLTKMKVLVKMEEYHIFISKITKFHTFRILLDNFRYYSEYFRDYI